MLIRYLGDYIEDLDKKQLQFSILGGNMELQNLCLKTSALNKLNLPILVKAGAHSHIVVTSFLYSSQASLGSSL